MSYEICPCKISVFSHEGSWSVSKKVSVGTLSGRNPVLLRSVVRTIGPMKSYVMGSQPLDYAIMRLYHGKSAHHKFIQFKPVQVEFRTWKVYGPNSWSVCKEVCHVKSCPKEGLSHLVGPCNKEGPSYRKFSDRGYVQEWFRVVVFCDVLSKGHRLSVHQQRKFSSSKSRVPTFSFGSFLP